MRHVLSDVRELKVYFVTHVSHGGHNQLFDTVASVWALRPAHAVSMSGSVSPTVVHVHYVYLQRYLGGGFFSMHVPISTRP